MGAATAGPASTLRPATRDSRSRRTRFLALWGAGLVASLAVTGASALGYLESLQARTLDLLLLLGGQRFPSEVVVVAVDDATFEALGARRPIPRGHLAAVIRGLQRAGAAVVGLDIALDVATTPAEDGALAEAIAGFSQDGLSRVVVLDTPAAETSPLATSAFQAIALRGSDRVPVDSDGVIRRTALFVRGPAGGLSPVLAVAVLARAGGPDAPARLATAARTGSLTLPTWRAGGGVDAIGAPLPFGVGDLPRISFVGPEKSFLTIPSSTVARLGDPGTTVPADNPLRGRIVLVGATFRDSRDFFQTPVNRLPGVEVHANVVDMLGSRRLIRPSGWLTSLAVQVLVTLVAAVILTFLRPLLGSLVAIALTLAVGLPASYAAFHGGGYAVDFVLPVLAVCILGVVAHAQARRRVRQSFGRYIGRDVLAQIVADAPALEGTRREVSILVSDIRGFTTFSEKLPAEIVASHLNAYFPAMVDAIFAHRGTVDDFIGDGILAVFGAPIEDSRHSRQAVEAAVAMQSALERLNREWSAQGLPTLRMGVGVHTGMVFAGSIGSRERAKYTVIGDPVNVTARLEGLNKDLGTTILLTEAIRSAIGDLVETRFRGDLPVKGRAEPLRVYEIVSPQPSGQTGTGG
jgi:adenylate cyclase